MQHLAKFATIQNALFHDVRQARLSPICVVDDLTSVVEAPQFGESSQVRWNAISIDAMSGLAGPNIGATTAKL